MGALPLRAGSQLRLPAACIPSRQAALDCSPPFRPTDGTCHEFSYEGDIPTNVFEDTAALYGTAKCEGNLGADGQWKYARTELGTSEKGKKIWIHYCRHCGLPPGAILMW